jgi:DNA-binding transcriptional regulator YhcF (GntR family)
LANIEKIKELLKMMDKDKIHGKPNTWMWRTLELIALASDYGQDGLLPSVADCARHLKISRKAMAKALHKFNKGGIVHETSQGWVVDRLQENPASSSSDESIRHTRKRHTSAAQRNNQGIGSSKQAFPFYD